MDIQLRTNRDNRAEVTVKSIGAIIVEDLSGYSPSTKRWHVSEADIDKFFVTAMELANFNGMSDVEFIRKVFYNFLTPSEREEFLKSVTE